MKAEPPRGSVVQTWLAFNLSKLVHDHLHSSICSLLADINQFGCLWGELDLWGELGSRLYPLNPCWAIANVRTRPEERDISPRLSTFGHRLWHSSRPIGLLIDTRVPTKWRQLGLLGTLLGGSHRLG